MWKLQVRISLVAWLLHFAPAPVTRVNRPHVQVVCNPLHWLLCGCTMQMGLMWTKWTPEQMYKCSCLTPYFVQMTIAQVKSQMCSLRRASFHPVCSVLTPSSFSTNTHSSNRSASSRSSSLSFFYYFTSFFFFFQSTFSCVCVYCDSNEATE